MALSAIWQFTDLAVQARMVYGPKRSWSILPEKTCFICYNIPNLLIRKQLLFNYIIILLTEKKLNIKVLKSKPFKNDLLDQ